MTKYKLVNESIAQDTIDDLEDYLSESKNTIEYKFDNEFRMDVGDLSVNIKNIKHFQDEQTYDYLNDFLSDDYLDIEELTYCLSGLNPHALHAIRDNLPNTYRNRPNEPVDLLKLFFQNNSSIYRKLYKAATSIDGFAYEENSELLINSEVFIQWSIKKGFIEKINDIDNQNHATEKYSTWQKNHNTVVVLMALEKRWEEDEFNNKENTTPSKLLRNESTNFYKSIKDKLVPKHKSSNELPTAKTLRNYISAHNSFKDSLNKN